MARSFKEYVWAKDSGSSKNVMVLHLSNGNTQKIGKEETVIVPVLGRQFNIEDPDTWESDRAWAFAQVGQDIWTGVGNETATILKIT